VFIATNFREVGSTGVHTHFEQLRNYLTGQGCEVAVVTPYSWCRPLTYFVFSPRLVLRYINRPASVLWYRHWHTAFLYRGLRRRLAGSGACVVYAQGPLEAGAALRARRGPDQRVVLAVHFRSSQADEYSEPGRELKRDGALYRAMRHAERDVILAVDGMVYVSEWSRDAVLAWLPEAASVPSAVIGNSVAPLEVSGHVGPLADIVTVGRLDAGKNHRFLLEVLAAAKQAGRVVTLDIYGDGVLRRDLEQQISALGLDGQVRLRGFRRDVRTFLPAYRVYVHPAHTENAPLAVIEAMAAGLPVVAAPIGGIPELVHDGIEGRHWSLDDPVSAAAVLTKLLDSPAELEEAGKAARARFERDFDLNVVGARMRSFLLQGLTA
jgi:glycosyltransferase involved in cell wall biosynthesis